ncbi:NAD(P)/FAD-dependent oxidoreductase [Leptothrix discophora]|uniref:NAD(P)-binding protein n=1 Tax=Leptothrix discophora TaxID=89 RepID=A0ABT9G8G6_LEPDI|nr:NAD(P)-binding protein [Leptothrix discophora]MDP4302784.1 NAD(P)-binding protein [Leptothrix discophora]
MTARHAKHIAVIGAGFAGALTARTLTRAGHRVQVFDKSRGAGGRLATRRMAWVDPAGQEVVTRMDHGAPGVVARSAGFQAFLDAAVQAGWMATWEPVLSPRSRTLPAGQRLHVAMPDQPEPSRRLLDGLPCAWGQPVDALHRTPTGWRVSAGGVLHGAGLGAGYDAVVLAIPPAQAAPLIAPHRADWSTQAASVPMQPCWTLMGVADLRGSGALRSPEWALSRPASGPLAWLMRNDARPGRTCTPGQAQWVAHARADWSAHHLESTPEEVLPLLQAALAAQLGQPVQWLHATVHRWRYAQPPADLPASSCWWDASLALGVCGDFLGGGEDAVAAEGVERAWRSARALGAAMAASSASTIGWGSALAATSRPMPLSRPMALA